MEYVPPPELVGLERGGGSSRMEDTAGESQSVSTRGKAEEGLRAGE